jgi:hypothetical protein
MIALTCQPGVPFRPVYRIVLKAPYTCLEASLKSVPLLAVISGDEVVLLE